MSAKVFLVESAISQVTFSTIKHTRKKHKNGTTCNMNSYDNRRVRNSAAILDQDRELTGAVFIDLRKAFDSVNHTLLLDKIRSCGITDTEFGFGVTSQTASKP